ncbi:DUF262 domain-containing protein [Gluconacetobacter diazotrophicus]|uniref:DUF262 domain-containing protein n=1 Tax=Gluconacetobacter diazotrophicus TaxID=33996 RepID=UPI001C93DCC3|nr:DUF262 domain-containing protein [Gluconacetobacter diazotrophicus]
MALEAKGFSKVTKRPIRTTARSSRKLQSEEMTPQLLPHEQLTFTDENQKNKSTDEELNSRYAKGDIRIVTESARYSLAGILSMLQEKVSPEGKPDAPTEFRYKLDPEYQRRHRWSDERKSRLIESFLMNVPVPPVFLYERDLARFEVMDGRQRLTALSEFYENKFSLTGLQYWSDLEGRTYSQLPSKIRDGIDRRYISSIILLKETAATDEQAALLKKIVFERLNSGGVKLSGQETRNAVYHGPLNALCLELSANKTFRKLWGIPAELETTQFEDNDEDSDTTGESTASGIRMFEKMEDVELVLRFFAYRQISGYKAGLNKITEFLDIFLMKGNNFPKRVLNNYRTMFNSTIEFLWNALGIDAFTIISDKKRQGRPSKIVYDSIMLIASSPEIKAAHAKLLRNKSILRDELISLYKRDQAGAVPFFSGRRTNYVDTQKRDALIKEAFFNALRKAK